jgi:hypothetical protein
VIVVDPTQDALTQKRSIMQVMEPFQQLLGSEGWQLFATYLEGEEAAVMADLTKSTTGEQALRCATALTVLRRTRTHPLNTVQFCRQMLEQLDSQE